MERLVKVWQMGKIDYTNALKLQKYIASTHHNPTNSSKINDTLLLLEHPPVYTTGIRTKQYSEDEEYKLKQLGAEFHRTDRGGLITFHGPGQLVVYPILNLKKFNQSIKWYVCQIEKTIIDLCKNYGLKAETSPHTGVWINDKKICAIGLQASRFITRHGLALNCSTDLNWFDHIVPCGIEGKGVTSLSKELNRTVEIQEVIPHFLNSFTKIFDCIYINLEDHEAQEILQKTK